MPRKWRLGILSNIFNFIIDFYTRNFRLQVAYDVPFIASVFEGTWKLNERQDPRTALLLGPL
jgi:hypothetical protein